MRKPTRPEAAFAAGIAAVAIASTAAIVPKIQDDVAEALDKASHREEPTVYDGFAAGVIVGGVTVAGTIAKKLYKP